LHHDPDYAQHKAFHDDLTRRVVEFQKSFDEGRTAMSVELLQFLKDWLGHHIGETDKKVATYLKTLVAA
jgi:hemerythrin